MMGEQRFEFYSDDYLIGVLDNVTGKTLNHFATIDLLNEQQATISALKEENDILKQKLRKNYIANKQYEEMKRLQEENEQLRTQLLVCQQSKSDDGRIKVWQVPPIPKGMRITTSTTFNGEKDE